MRILTSTAALCVIAFALTGCKAREMGTAFSENQSARVDDSWVTALNACWPDLTHQGWTTEGLKHNLSDPIHFRAAFGTYGAQSDAQLNTIVAQPIMDAPPPDTTLLTNASSPILTRGQAMSGGNAANAVAQGTQNSAAPPDALCSIHNGSPVGFK